MQPGNSFTVQLTGGISSVDTLEKGMETSPSNINYLREYFTLLLLYITHHP